MKKFATLFLIAFVIVSLIFSYAPFAFAKNNVTEVDGTLYFDIPFSKPQLDANHSYIELVYSNGIGDFYTIVKTFSNYLFEYSDGSTAPATGIQMDVDLYFDTGIVTYAFHSSDNNIRLGFTTFDLIDATLFPDNSHNYYFYSQIVSPGDMFNITPPSGYYLYSYHLYGELWNVNTHGTTSVPSFTFLYSEDVVFFNQLQSIADSLFGVFNYMEGLDINVEKLTLQLEQIYNHLLSQSNDLSVITSNTTAIKDFCSQLYTLTNDIKNELLEHGLSLDDINLELDNIFVLLSNIDSFIQTYLPEIWYTLIYINEDTTTIISKLDEIIAILNQSGDSDLTSPDPSHINGFINAENSLLHNSNVNVGDAVKVEINQNSLGVIWGIVDEVLNLNPKLFGLVLTIIAFGVIAMILGRKV